MSVHWVRPSARHCLHAGTCNRDQVRWGSSELNTHVQKHTHTQPMCSWLFHSSQQTCSLFKKKKKSKSKLPLSHTFQSHFPEMSVNKKYRPFSEFLPWIDKYACVPYCSVLFYKSGLTLCKKYHDYSSTDWLWTPFHISICKCILFVFKFF